MSNKLFMTDSEICRSYRYAKNQNAQIGILADMNCCSEQDIKNILVASGDMTESSTTKNNLPTKNKKGLKWSVEMEKDLISWYEGGIKPSEIAERMGVDRTAVANKINKMKRAGYIFDLNQKGSTNVNFAKGNKQMPGVVETSATQSMCEECNGLNDIKISAIKTVLGDNGAKAYIIGNVIEHLGMYVDNGQRTELEQAAAGLSWLLKAE